MCGIYCYVGKKKALPILTKGLSCLEYRGYDSAGIAYVTDKVNIIKEKGKLENLEYLLNKGDLTEEEFITEFNKAKPNEEVKIEKVNQNSWSMEPPKIEE